MPCKPIALCSSLLLSQRKQKQKREIVLHEVVQPTPLRKGKPELGASNNSKKLHSQAQSQNCEEVVEENAELQKTKKKNKAMEDKVKPLRRSSSQAHRDFLKATTGGSEGKVVSLEALPSSEQAFSQFATAYPRYTETRILDQLRLQEYSHLEDEELVCLDYCGFGMFTNAQREDINEQEEEEDNGFTSSFTLTEITANLWSNALFGCYPDGSMEWGIRMRIMEFLNISETEYSMVFTASRGATFKLLADAYPWSSNNRLVTMYDYESESVGWMEQRATERGAKVYRARFRWPSLRVCSSELKRELLIGSSKKSMKGKKQQCSSAGTGGGSGGNSSRLAIASWLDRVSHQQQDTKKQQKKGLFVFPVQSRVSGAKYSYQWMSLAQQNNWHVMLDASALGPKDMDSLGLSLFRPDFITASFYRLFGGDPSGFSCLFIKNSVIQSIQDPEGTVVSGMVRIMPLYQQPSCSGSSFSGESDGPWLPRMISSFSGPVPAYDDVDAANSHDCLDDSAGEDNYSSACEDPEDDPEDPDNHSGGHSPVFSEDGNDNDYADAQSLSQELNNGPIREDNEQLPQPTALAHQQSVKKDAPSSRSRIKGLCSGLLHLHTSRVGNSGEDGNCIKDGDKIYPEDNENGDLAIIKQLSAKKLELLDSGKSVVTAVSVSKSQQSKSGSAETAPIKEKVPDKLRLVLKKSKEEQSANTVKESEKKLSIRKGAAEVVHQVEEICPAGLETIQEIEVEAENPKLSEQEQDRVDSSNNLQSLTKDNAIRRETDGGFRLLGRRNSDKFALNRIMATIPSSDSFHSRSIGGSSELSFKSEEDQFEGEGGEEEEEEKVQEPQLLCRSLDHADMLGLNRTSFRLRYLINWLISSLLRLRHPGNDLSLVRIYGPQVRYDRGASVAFNIFDANGRMLHPDLVRAMAEQFNIYLGLGFLRNIFLRGNVVEAPVPGLLDKKNSASQSRNGNSSSRVEVVTAGLGLLSDFRDVYRLWAFVARFLDTDYVASELGHLQLTASNLVSSSRQQSNAEHCIEIEQ